jgi:hypothetical protein
MSIEPADEFGQAGNQRAPWLPAADPGTTGDALVALIENASVEFLERIAEHPNTPCTVLTQLGAHADSNVRAAVTDNPNASEEVILLLCFDNNPDIRFRIAENHNMAPGTLNIMDNDDNPYVAERARKTIRRLASQGQVAALTKTRLSRLHQKNRGALT